MFTRLQRMLPQPAQRRPATLAVRLWAAAFAHPGRTTVVLALVHALLNLGMLFPRIFQINVIDTAGYINSGRVFINGLSEGRYSAPEFAWNPLVSLFYGAIYIPFHKSLHWLILSEWTGRLIMYAGIWATAYLIAREWRRLVHPLIPMAVLFLLPIFQPLLYEPPYGLFAILSGLAFWQVVRFAATAQFRYLTAAAGLLGLATLTRNDGLVLFPVFLVCVALISTVAAPVDGRLRRGALSITLGAGAFGAVVGGYLTVQGVVNRSLVWETPERTYSVFEIAEGTAYSNELDSYMTGIERARELYGTPEENGYSILAAIRRNPEAFLARVRQVASTLWLIALKTYGGLLALPLFGAVALGAAELLRRKAWPLLLLSLLWPAFLATYFLFFFQTYYLAMPFYVLLPLAALGVQRIASAAGQHPIRVLVVPLLMVHIFGLWFLPQLAQYAPMFGYTGLGVGILLLVVAGGASAWWPGRGGQVWTVAPAAVLALLVLRPPFPPPQLPALGTSGEARTAAFLSESFPRASVIAAYSPPVILSAKMRFTPMFLDIKSIKEYDRFDLADTGELARWMGTTGTVAIYSDFWLQLVYPDVYALVDEARQNGHLREVFRYEDPDPVKRRFLEAVAPGQDLRPIHSILVSDPAIAK